MDPKFSYIASSLLDVELLDRINNRKKYLPDSVEAALAELRYRKHEFSDEDIRQINEDIRLKRANAALVGARLGGYGNNLKNVIVIDPDAPILYSRRAIYIFTFLCGALFGSILLAININKVGKSINAFWTILFGIVFTAIQLTIINNNDIDGSGAIIGGLIAAYLLDYFFWRPFIGYSTYYRVKSIWIPLIIALVLVGLLLAAVMIYSIQL